MPAQFLSQWRRELSQLRRVAVSASSKNPRRLEALEALALVDYYLFVNLDEEEQLDRLHARLGRDGCVSDYKTLVEISNWKTNGRTNRYLPRSDEKINSATGTAFRIIDGDKSPEASTEAMDHLWIGGMGIPMMSTLFTMYDPENYGVIDRNAWLALKGVEKQISSYGQWKEYLEDIRELKGRLNLPTCRHVDMVLWQMGSFQNERTG